jgi:hypothetical protein
MCEAQATTDQTLGWVKKAKNKIFCSKLFFSQKCMKTHCGAMWMHGRVPEVIWDVNEGVLQRQHHSAESCKGRDPTDSQNNDRHTKKQTRFHDGSEIEYHEKHNLRAVSGEDNKPERRETKRPAHEEGAEHVRE